MRYGYDDRTKGKLLCEDCEGTGFNRLLKKYKIHGKNMYDIWNMTIDEGEDYFSSLDSKVSSLFRDASSIMLGHLKLGQPTSSLSGGENIRIKIMKSARTSSSIIGIDEPFRGLSSSEIYRVSLFLNNMVNAGKTVIVADHSEVAERFFAHTIILHNRDGILTD